MFCQHPPSFFVWVCVIRTRLELIVSSPRNALNTYLSTLNAGISIMVHQVKLIKFLMKMVNYFMSFFMLSNLIFFWRTSRGIILKLAIAVTSKLSSQWKTNLTKFYLVFYQSDQILPESWAWTVALGDFVIDGLPMAIQSQIQH